MKKYLTLLLLGLAVSAFAHAKPVSWGKAGIVPAVGKKEFQIVQVACRDIGDIYILISPDGKVTLLDCGTEISNQLCLFPALKKFGIKHIDQVIISHPHDDHHGALPSLLKNPDFTIGKICRNDISEADLTKNAAHEAQAEIKIIREIKRLAAEKKIPLEEIKTGDVIDFGGGAKGQVLITAAPKLTISNYINNNSIVFMFRYGDFRMLFTGDMGIRQEQRLLATGASLKCDILKVPHHAGTGASGKGLLTKSDPCLAVVCMPQRLFKDPRGVKGIGNYQKMNIPVLCSWQYPVLDIITDGCDYRLVAYTWKHVR